MMLVSIIVVACNGGGSDVSSSVDGSTESSTVVDSSDGLGDSSDSSDETETYTVTFKTSETITYRTVLVEEGKTVTLPTEPKKSGYIFQYWATSEQTRFDETQPITADITLTASWQQIEYSTVTFMMDETVIYRTISVENGKALTQPNNPTKSGYVFEYWLSADETPFDFEQLITEDIILTAVWSQTHQVYYYDDMGVSLYVETVKDGEVARYAETPDDYETDYQTCTFNMWVTELGGNVAASLDRITGTISVYVSFNRTAKVTIEDTLDFVINVETGTQERYVSGQVGGTLITISENGTDFQVKHVYCNI